MLTKDLFLSFKRGKKLIIPRAVSLAIIWPTLLIGVAYILLGIFGVSFFGEAIRVFIVLGGLLISGSIAATIVFIRSQILSRNYRQTFSPLFEEGGTAMRVDVWKCLDGNDIEGLAKILKLAPECKNDEFMEVNNKE